MVSEILLNAYSELFTENYENMLADKKYELFVNIITKAIKKVHLKKKL